MEMRLERLKERLDLYEKLMRLDKPNRAYILQTFQSLCNFRKPCATTVL